MQRVKGAGVSVSGGAFREIGEGLVLLVGIKTGDDEKTAAFMAEKAVHLRLFDDADGNLNRSLLDCNGECLVVSNFTLYANCRHGRRPSFVEAAPRDSSKPLYEYFIEALRRAGVKTVVDGEFGSEMQVRILNDGPVTVLLDSGEIMPKK